MAHRTRGEAGPREATIMDMIALIDGVLRYLNFQLGAIRELLASMRAEGAPQPNIDAGVAEEREVTTLMAQLRDARGFIADAIDERDEDRTTRH
jgi:DNA-binding transcriptional MerR regulator